MRSYFIGLFFSILYVGVPVLSDAQVVFLGPKAGIQVSMPEFENKDIYDSYRRNPGLGWNAGMVMNFKVSKMFSFETELVFSDIQRSITSEIENDNTSHKEHYYYLSVPLLLRTSITHGYNQYYFNVGPNLSYWLGGKGWLKTPDLEEYTLNDGMDGELFYKIRFKDFPEYDIYNQQVREPNRLQLGLDVGIGAVFPMQRQSLMVDLRYTWGHSNMVKEEVDYVEFVGYKDDLRFSNQTLSLSVAYLFSFDYLQARKGKTTDKTKRKK